MRNGFRRWKGWMVAGAVVSMGCSTAAMPVPAGLTAADRLDVEGRQGWQPKRIAFGPYEARGIDRSWTKGSGWRLTSGDAGVDRQRRRQSYSFEVAEAGAPLGRVACEVAAHRGTVVTEVVDVDVRSGVGLECEAEAGAAVAGEQPAWTLRLDADGNAHLTGRLQVGEGAYTVRGVGPGGRYGPAETFGFEIRRDSDGLTVAAVETVNGGSVRLHPRSSADERRVLAGAAAALLLFEELATEE